ncbi:hypothetical protein ACFQ61_23445 [Streptomyces sp. NPDC056500]
MRIHGGFIVGGAEPGWRNQHPSRPRQRTLHHDQFENRVGM